MTDKEIYIKKLTHSEVDHQDVAAFKNYCIQHGGEHDESFTMASSMEEFKVDEENPTYLLMERKGNQEELIGVASLMLSEYFRRGNRGRVRIIHTIKPSKEAYKLLTEAIKPHINGLDHLFLFVPLKMKETCGFMDELGYIVNRYVYYMERELSNLSEAHFPDGYELKNLVFGKDEPSWCRVRNANFAKLPGNETPVTEEEVAEMEKRKDHLEGGLKLLWKDGEVVGAIGIHSDNDEDEVFGNIGPIVVDENHRGKNLGRNMLRAALEFSREQGYKKAGLSVNADNKNAAGLYLSEGFKEEIALACLHLK